MIPWHILALPFMLALTACGEGERDQQCASLFGGGSYCLQPTTALAPFDLQQKVEANFRGRRETLIANIESDASGVRFVGLTPLGHKLLQVSYDNRAVSAAMLPDKRLNPTLVLALLQIALWPPEVVRTGLEAPLALEDSHEWRHITQRGEKVLSINYRGDQLPYRHMLLHIPAADFAVEVETLPEIGKEQ
jgi:hypothetical protein